MIYLSPHLDDAAYSCGGLLWEQAQAGLQPLVVTVCAGNPPPEPLSPFAQSLHERWETGLEALAVRRREDQTACQIVGADFRHWDLPDCIYRRDPDTGKALYDHEEALFGLVDPVEEPLIKQLGELISRQFPAQAELVSPLTLGGHVDHRLVRAAAETTGRSLWYYPDFPYVLEANEQLKQLRDEGWVAATFPISPLGVAAWEAGAAAYASQFSTFWGDLNEMHAAIERIVQENGGVTLWKRPFKNEFAG